MSELYTCEPGFAGTSGDRPPCAELRARAEKAEAEAARLEKLVKRMASAASNYGARVYMVGYEPDIAEHLTDEEIRTNSERPSEHADRMADDLSRLRDGIQALADEAERLADGNGVGFVFAPALRGLLSPTPHERSSE